ncbi:hypothetical protein E5843_07410 [Luteimonas yindakuii]|uniref:hypothetical protein n=1 Tax=Luteimonas yindakuii TaxID=2565782 RepID=UPI0011076158|nr:hypothetical protein [Luteimonas yindakuii]QCO67642.2 hypothetical protein E5843_07410 [Luteimonas yindakuii]
MEIALYACAALVAAALTWLARRYAMARRLVDQPGERRSHQTATPRGGGIAIVLVMLAVLLWSGRDTTQAGFALPSALGLVLVAGVGWWDDHRPLSARLRLAVHIVAALLLAAAFREAGLDAVTAIVICGTAVVLVNVWNFMDGINGLAVSQAALVAATAAVIAGPDTTAWLLGWLLVAACIGFVPFNFPHARIFLGDVGSGALGYLLALLAGMVALEHTGTPVRGAAALLLLPASAFLVDAALTLGRRILRREHWWQPHVQHAYQALARQHGHTATTVAYGLWSLAGMLLACCLARSGYTFGFMMAAAVAAWQGMGALWWRYLQDSEHG